MRRRLHPLQHFCSLLAIVGFALAGCSSIIYDPNKRIPNLTKISEFPIAGEFSFGEADDKKIYAFTPRERVEFHSDDGKTLFLYSWGVVKAGAYRPLWEVDQFFTFEHGVYKTASGWLTVVPVDRELATHSTIDGVRSKLGPERLRASLMRTRRTRIESSGGFYLFSRYGSYLLLQADSNGRILGARQWVQGQSPGRAMQHPDTTMEIGFWKALPH